MTEHNHLDSDVLAVMANNIEHIQSDIERIRNTMAKSFITKEQHNALADKVKWIQTIVFGMVGLILIGFMTAVVNFFIQGS